MNNLEFTCNIDPDNTAAQEKYEWAKAKREKRLTTVSLFTFLCWYFGIHVQLLRGCIFIG